jgi:hypothetical protein
MGFYTEKRDQLIEKIKVLEKRIASDTAKKKSLEEKLKDATRLAMAEEYNCKPRELDEIISSEHLLLQKLRASGMSDAELLELCGVKTSDSTDSNVAADSNTDSDEIRFYDDPIVTMIDPAYSGVSISP